MEIKETEDFRITEAESLPADWVLAKVKDIFEFSKKPRKFQFARNEKVIFLPMDLVSDDCCKVRGWQKKDASDISSGTFVYKNDLIIAKITPCFENGKQAILNDLPADYGYATTEVWALHPKNDSIICEHLYNYIKNPLVREKLSTMMEGTTGRQRLPRHVMENLLIPLPPLPEQQRIAYVLSAVQVARDKTQAVIEAAREMKKSLMKHLFTYGPVPVAEVGKVQLKETEIGIIPEHWEVKKLGDIASNIRSGSTPRGGSTTYLDKGIPLIRSQNVLMNNLVLDDVAYVSKETHEIMLRSQIQPGDVLLNITGASIGRVAIAPSTLKEANVNQHVCRIRPKEGLISEFLSYYLASEIGQWQIMSTQIGATRQGLNYQQVRSFSLPVPHLEEQAKIVEALAAIDLKVHAEEMHMTALDTLFKTLLNNLMTGKIRVNHLEMAQ